MNERMLLFIVVGVLVYFAIVKTARPAFGAPSGVLTDPTTGVPVTPDWWVPGQQLGPTLGGGGGGGGRVQVL